MVPTLQGIDLKLRRADEHLAYLNQAGTDFLNVPRPVNVEYEAASNEYVLRYADEQPPPEWGVTVSEFAHLLRSSLDNLLYQLIALRRKGKRPEHRSQFRIYDDVPKPPWKKGSACAGNAKWDPWSGIKGVLPPDATVIKEAQPYQLGTFDGVKLSRWHPLSMLGYLNNVDKHRLIHPSVALGGYGVGVGPFQMPVFFRDDGRLQALHSGKFSLTLPSEDGPLPFPLGPNLQLTNILLFVRVNGIPLYNGFTIPKPTEDSAVMLRLNADGPPPANAKVEVEPAPTLVISFSDIERPMSIYDLYEIRRKVGEVVDQFRVEFV